MINKHSISICLFILLFSTTVNAQQEKPAIKLVSAQFEKWYNLGNYDSIFNMFDSNMKTALPQKATTDFLSGIQKNAGKIVTRDFQKYVHGSFASYKTKFEKALLSVNISIDAQSSINGIEVTPFIEEKVSALKRNITHLEFPAKGEWTIIWGGDTKELNYHVESKAQKNAFDILIKGDSNKSYQTNGKTNEDYYAFGKQLNAPCNAEVVLVVDGIKDNIPGEMNPIYVPGNTVILKTSKNEFLFFAHFKQHSIVVKQGQKLQKGQLLGLCGNSGNSSEPHIHFHIQDTENMMTATGIKCYFEKLMVNGFQKTDYSPIQNEKISQ
jgi:murein DD-endopeptidase MepM/ murein hydrolase activator NlpD